MNRCWICGRDVVRYRDYYPDGSAYEASEWDYNCNCHQPGCIPILVSPETGCDCKKRMKNARITEQGASR